jgi:hypothetical protein
MSRSLRLLLFSLLLIGSGFASAQEPTEPDPDPRLGGTAEPPAARSELDPAEGSAGDRVRDERSVVLVERVCASTLDREELTLFANGTVRLRHTVLGQSGGPEKPSMALGELPPDELEAWVDRLREEDLGDTEAATSGPGGDWVERCRLVLDYDAMARWVGPAPEPGPDHAGWRPAGTATYRWGRLDSLSLSLARILGLVDGIAARVDPAVGRRSLPPEYAPRAGDVLRRADGVLFRVERPTASKGGWELQAVDQPLVLYVVESEVPHLFVELVRRR